MIEVLVASILLIVVMYGLAQYFTRGRTQVDYEEDRRKATAVAQDRLEQARRWSFDYIQSRAAGNGSSANDTTYAVDGRSYTVSLWVTEADTVAAGNPVNDFLTRVRATVKWTFPVDYNQSNLATRTLDATTLIGRSRL